MKKLLNLLATISLTVPTSSSIIACGNRGLSSTTIKYGIVDNGVDQLSQNEWKEIEDKYYSLYGTKYKLEAMKEIGDSELPEKILQVGANVGPDVYTASVDMVSKLAANNAILALNGSDAPPFMNKILEDLNYNVEYANSILKKPMEERTSEEEWGTFLPYAIESSNMVNNNEHSQNKGEKAQYGITRGLGVGGGSSIVKKTLNEVLTKIGFEYKDKNKNLNPIGKTSLKKMSNYSAKVKTKDPKKPNELIPMLIDRGMWEMYPFYSNVISKKMDDGIIYKAAEIGVNWINDSNLPYYFASDGKYSTIFSNPYFIESTKEILTAFFNYFAQLYKVALNKLKGNNIYDKPENLLNPSQGVNAKVKNQMIEKDYAVSTTSEPSNYTTFISAAKCFKNMEFIDMNSVRIFDEIDEKELALKYEKQGLNNWMTPSGSSIFVFSRNLGKDKQKALASMKFVELALGFQEKNGQIINDGVGGIFDLQKGFLNSSILPSRIAINNPKWVDDPSFIKGIEEKKVPRRVEATVIGFNKYRETFNEDSVGETKAIVNLEKYSIEVASRMYNSDENNLSLAPNVSSYDSATKSDWHGINAMKPQLENAFVLSKEKFQEIYGNFDEQIDFNLNKFKQKRNEFIDKFLLSMTRLNKEMDS